MTCSNISMESCIFCKIIKGKIPGKIIYRDTDVIVFYDISPKAPVHFLVVPVKHLPSLREVNDEDQKLLGKLLFTARKIAEDLKIAGSGYKVVMNNGKDAGQLVYHLHLHVLGGWRKKEDWVV